MRRGRHTDTGPRPSAIDAAGGCESRRGLPPAGSRAAREKSESRPVPHGSPVEKDMPPLAFERHADRKLVWEEPHRLLGTLAEPEMRVPPRQEVLLERLAEIAPFVLFGTEPPMPGVGQDRIQEHETT